MKYRRTRGCWVLLACWFFSIVSLVSAEPGQVRWTYSSGLTNYTDLALGPDGTIYLGWTRLFTVTNELGDGGTIVSSHVTNHLFALTSSGNDQWQLPGTGHDLAIRSDGKILTLSGRPRRIVYVPLPSGGLAPGLSPSDYRLSGIHPDGSVWFEDVNAGHVAITADDDAVALMVEVPDGTPYTNAVARLALQPTSTGWTNVSRAFDFADTRPVIAADGSSVFVTRFSAEPVLLPSGSTLPSRDFANELFVLTANGVLKSVLYETNVNYATPATGSDGKLFLASSRMIPAGEDFSIEWYFRALSSSGNLLWTVTNAHSFGPAVVDRTNNVYTGSGTKLYSFTTTGTERWVYEADSLIDLCPALAADDTIYAVTRGGKLLALDTSNGSLRWSYDSGRSIHFPPTIGADGTVYLLIDNSDLVAIEGTAPPADAPWPQDRHDAQRTSRATQASTSGLTRAEDGKFSLMLNLEPGRDYRVEASEDLLTWSEIGSFTSSSAARTFLDETSAGKSKRFYRLVMPGATP